MSAMSTFQMPREITLVRDGQPDVRCMGNHGATDPGAELLDSLAALSITPDQDVPRLTLHTILARGLLGSVHRATLSTTPVIVKLVTGAEKLAALQHEAAMYAHAAHLQGAVLPKFYGLYTTNALGVTFIVLEDCGAPVKARNFAGLAGEIKLGVMQALKQLHDAGLEHGDLQPWNVLQNDQDDVRLVGLNAALVHVGCPARRVVMTQEWCFREAVGELACDELVEVGERMAFGSQDGVVCG